MLALTRKKGESIMVGDEVEIIVLSISGEQVKLGIVAPKRIAVHRKEIYEQIQAENKEASSIANIKSLNIPIFEVKKSGNTPENEDKTPSSTN